MKTLIKSTVDWVATYLVMFYKIGRDFEFWTNQMLQNLNWKAKIKLKIIWKKRITNFRMLGWFGTM